MRSSDFFGPHRFSFTWWNVTKTICNLWYQACTVSKLAHHNVFFSLCVNAFSFYHSTIYFLFRKMLRTHLRFPDPLVVISASICPPLTCCGKNCTLFFKKNKKKSEVNLFIPIARSTSLNMPLNTEFYFFLRFHSLMSPFCFYHLSVCGLKKGEPPEIC